MFAMSMRHESHSEGHTLFFCLLLKGAVRTDIYIVLSCVFPLGWHMRICPLKCCEMLVVNIQSKPYNYWLIVGVLRETCLETLIIFVLFWLVQVVTETQHFNFFQWITAMGPSMFACTTQAVWLSFQMNMSRWDLHNRLNLTLKQLVLRCLWLRSVVYALRKKLLKWNNFLLLN